MFQLILALIMFITIVTLVIFRIIDRGTIKHLRSENKMLKNSNQALRTNNK